MVAPGAPTDEPEFSVLIGRVSTEDGARILEALAALRRQAGAGPTEVIVVDRLADATTQEIEVRFPEVRLLHVPPETTLPAMRAAALVEARGRFVAVTEDHCLAPPDWLAGFARAFAHAPPDTFAIGGAVENGVDETALDHATFLCEYSAFVPPFPAGAGTPLPGMNVAYRRDALRRLDPRALAGGFWETTAHPALALHGRLVTTDAIRIVHAKRFRAAFFLRQRFHYSRHYAGTRFGADRILHRALACAGSVLLPAIVLARIAGNVRALPGARGRFVASLPWLALFSLAWAAGECVGYATGPGDSLRLIE